ncbi:MAG: TPM domain-containing protein [Vicinamibacteria bacterium]
MTAGRRAVPGLVALFALAAVVGAQVAVPPSPTRHATDLAGVVDAARLAALDAKLAAYDKKTSNQIVVYVQRTVPEGGSMEEYASAAFDAWGVGQKGLDNGVVFFVFVDDRRMRLELGGGAMKAISDPLAAEIIDTEAKPRFREKDYAGGIDAVVGRVIRALDAAGAPSGKRR